MEFETWNLVFIWNLDFVNWNFTKHFCKGFVMPSTIKNEKPMRPYITNLLYAILLIVLSLWGYFVSPSPSFTAFIPTVFGVLFLVMTPVMKRDNKTISHIVVALTLLLVIALVKPLTAAIGRSDTAATVRVSIMLVAGVVAMIIYIRSFVDARRSKKTSS